MWLKSSICTAVFSTCVTKHTIEVTLCQDKNTLLEKPTGRHIRMIWTKENTYLLYSTTRGHLNHTRWTFERRHKHSAQTPIVLSNFKATKWTDLKPLLVVNTSSHVNNVSKTSNSCFQWCLKMPKASALKQASAMYRFLCSRELKCMLAELFQTKVV